MNIQAYVSSEKLQFLSHARRKMQYIFQGLQFLPGPSAKSSYSFTELVELLVKRCKYTKVPKPESSLFSQNAQLVSEQKAKWFCNIFIVRFCLFHIYLSGCSTSSL